MKYISPNYIMGNLGGDHQMDSPNHLTHSKLDFGQDAIFYSVPPYALITTGTMGTLWVSEYACQHKLFYWKYSKSLSILLSAVSRHLNKWPYSLWGKTEGIVKAYSCNNIGAPLLLGTGEVFNQWVPSLKTGSGPRVLTSYWNDLP